METSEESLWGGLGGSKFCDRDNLSRAYGAGSNLENKSVTN